MQPKPGIKTTEAWASLIAGALVAFAPKFGLEISGEMQAQLIALIVGVYTLSRGIAKKGK